MADCVQPATRNIYIRPWNARAQQGQWRHRPKTTAKRAADGDARLRRHQDIHAGRYHVDNTPLDRREYPEKKRKPRFKVAADGRIVSEYAQHFSAARRAPANNARRRCTGRARK